MNRPEGLARGHRKRREAAGFAVRRRKRQGIFVGPQRQTVGCMVAGTPILFTVVNPRDEIQKHHLLSGMTALLKQCSPHIVIEADQENQPGFMSWLNEAGDQVLKQFQRYARHTNHLIGPVTPESGSGLSGEP
jgi:hypothetical protein